MLSISVAKSISLNKIFSPFAGSGSLKKEIAAEQFHKEFQKTISQ